MDSVRAVARRVVCDLDDELDGAAGRVLGGVAEEVEEDLAEADGVADDGQRLELGRRVGRAVDVRADLCGFQSFNPTSMCAYSNDLDQTLWPYFENSTRAIDSPKKSAESTLISPS